MGDAALVGAKPNPSACLTKSCTMGYSMLTHSSGHEVRYTEWVHFNRKTFGKPDWDGVVGRELYNHTVDPMENNNVVGKTSEATLSELSELLHQHPVYREE